MREDLPFSPPGRVLDGKELQKVVRVVAEDKGLWAEQLQHRTNDRGYAEVFLDE
ncbi:hypothetical protein GCM10010377_52130 [Streptomyces viridiviolaceus]|uniref:Uncharacterized protein n=1 Tax=Streptomyces viridiviolaceus TaxID=68282 RepID=A0ABW2E388_9ACTN|nr:hypothetical protein [Streptomyces viridiviolaceus]GHB54584.1 hypothetical protein GCM10010377_52130 [Streptomyces viridiviolaceus]